MKENILITAALPYINNVPHVGHVIGSHLPADIFARFCRLEGNNVTFVGGADEHGTPAVITAKEVGVSTKTLVDKLKEEHKKVYSKLNISYDNFSGTSIPVHKGITQEFFLKMKENGYIEEQEIEMYYCEECKMFLPDRFIRGTCPKCGYEDADGDQCEKCFSALSSTELIKPRCYTCGHTPVIKKSKHYFFSLDKISDKLDAWLDSKKEVFRPYVFAEAKRWIKDGLKPRCITRDMNWGIPVVGEGFEDKVFYVWFEAPIGYISITNELSTALYETLWHNDNSKIYHFLGKDNIPFHTVFFPGMLLANGTYNMPYNVSGYNFLNYEGKKFSKSKRIGVFCTPLLTSDMEVDALRGYLTAILPENKDSDWKWDEFKNNTNSELIGKFGNFFNRTINLLYKNFPELDIDLNDVELNDEDKEVLNQLQSGAEEIINHYKEIELRDAYKSIMSLSICANTYLEHTAPWKLIKEENFAEAKKVLYICLNIAKTLAVLASPILPEKMAEIWTEQLCFDGQVSNPENFELLGKVTVAKGHKIGAPKPIFRRIDDDYLEKLKEEFSVPYELDAKNFQD